MGESRPPDSGGPDTVQGRKGQTPRSGDDDVATVGDRPSARGAGDARKEGGLLGDDELAVGTRAGRYILLHRLGSGGGGQVYAAYDPQLDRRVAIKLLRARDSSPRLSQGQARLLREGAGDGAPQASERAAGL